MPENYRLAREEEMQRNVERMDRARKAERDALATVRHFNARLSAGRVVWSWPKIAAALTSGHHWISILCEGCGTIGDLDLRIKSRDPEASIRVVLRDAQCSRCYCMTRQRIVGLRKVP